MRVCILGDSFVVPVRNLARFLGEAGHEVHLLGFGRPDLPPPARVHSLGPGRTLGMLSARRRVRDFVERFRPDVVHAFYLTSYGFAATGARGVPLLATSMGTDVFGAPDLSRVLWPARVALLRKAIRGADLVHSVAQHMTDRLIELGVEPGKIVTFPRGVSLTRFTFAARHDPPSPPFRIVCNRKLEPVYDHVTLIEGVARLAAAGTEFTLRIVGEGHLREMLQGLAARLGVSDRVRFSGNVRHEEMPSVLHEADVFVTASLSDGTSSCLLEALAAGCVPVASDIPANRPWLADGGGFLFRPGDAASCAEALGRSIAAASRWPDLRAANRARVEARGSLDEGHRRVVQMYRQILEQRSGRPLTSASDRPPAATDPR